MMMAWIHFTPRGCIQNTHLENIQIEGEVFPFSVIMSYSDQHRISNVPLESVRIHGRKAYGTCNGLITLIHADGIQIR